MIREILSTFFLGFSLINLREVSTLTILRRENTAGTTFAFFAKYSIHQGLGIQLLKQTGPRQALEDLPSWVPNWMIAQRSQPSYRYLKYRCAASTAADLTFPAVPPELLNVVGWQVDIVTKLGVAYPDISAFETFCPNGQHTTRLEYL